MKVAILTPTFSHFSGIDRVVEGQAEDFAKKGHQVTVIAFESTIEPKGYELKLLGMPKNQFWQNLKMIKIWHIYPKRSLLSKLTLILN